MAPQGAAGTKWRAEHIMSEYLDYRGYGATETRDRTHTLFGQTMGYVAVTAGFFALGAYLGRNLGHGWAIVGFIAAVVWQAGGAAALFVAGFGAAGYATRRDLSGVARVSFIALIALIVFGIVLIFVRIPHGSLVYSVLGLVIFAGLTMFDFQRLRRSKDLTSAPLIAASIFLDLLNVFLFFLRIFSRSD